MNTKTIDKLADFHEVIKTFHLSPNSLFTINTGRQMIEIKVIRVEKMNKNKTAKILPRNWIEDSFGGWKGLVDCKKLKKEIYLDRQLKTDRPVPKF